MLTPEQRRRNMARIRGRDTSPELKVRRLVHGLGYRYRLHVRQLPGKPDLVLRRLRAVVFVHGCFWHMHDCRYGTVTPKTNAEFWAEKRGRNVERDAQVVARLGQEWDVLVVWECELRTPSTLRERLATELGLLARKTARGRRGRRDAREGS